jgi:hypothetical protein
MWRSAALAVGLVAAAPLEARADCDGFGEAIGLVLFGTFDIVASIGGTVTAIGSTVQTQRDPPGLGWSIASFAVAGVDLLVAGVTTAFLVDIECSDPIPITLVAVPAALSLVNVVIAAVNLPRWSRAKDAQRRYEEDEDEEDDDEEDDQEDEDLFEEEDDEWSVGPFVVPGRDGGVAVGLGFSIVL